MAKYSLEGIISKGSNYETNSQGSFEFDQAGIYHSLSHGDQGWGCNCPTHRKIGTADINEDRTIKSEEETPTTLYTN